MGNMHAQEFARLANEGLEIDLALEMHLLSNHYPPIPLCMVEVAKKVIKAVQHASITFEDGTVEIEDPAVWEELVPLPAGILWKGQKTSPVHALFEHMHLNAFI